MVSVCCYFKRRNVRALPEVEVGSGWESSLAVESARIHPVAYPSWLVLYYPAKISGFDLLVTHVE